MRIVLVFCDAKAANCGELGVKSQFDGEKWLWAMHFPSHEFANWVSFYFLLLLFFAIFAWLNAVVGRLNFSISHGCFEWSFSTFIRNHYSFLFLFPFLLASVIFECERWLEERTKISFFFFFSFWYVIFLCSVVSFYFLIKIVIDLYCVVWSLLYLRSGIWLSSRWSCTCNS